MVQVPEGPTCLSLASQDNKAVQVLEQQKHPQENLQFKSQGS